MRGKKPWQEEKRKRLAAYVLREYYGVPKVAIAYALGVSRKTVDKWMKEADPREAASAYDAFRVRQY